MLGESGYTLTCKVIVANHLCPSTISYQWIKNNSIITQLETPPNSLSFSPLRLSDAGQYACQATIISSLPLNITVMGVFILKLQSKLSKNSEIAVCNFCHNYTVPVPFSVTLTSSVLNPVRPISCVNLTCIMHVRITALTPAVDIQLNTVWSGPGGFRAIITLQPIFGNSTTYTSRRMVSSFGRNESGIYTCTLSASFSSTNPYFINGGTMSDSNPLTTGEELESQHLTF